MLVKVNINGRDVEIEDTILSYRDLVKLAYPDGHPGNPSAVCKPKGLEGFTMYKGVNAHPANGMRFCVIDTGNA